MKATNTYLVFNGNCREAVKFYANALGAELQVMSFGDMPVQPGEGCNVPEDAKDRVMHARLTKGSIEIMASDSMPGMPFQAGNNFSINLSCENVEEAERLFAAFSQRAKITMPLGETFWAERFGMLTDQFGVNWMFNVEKPRESYAGNCVTEAHAEAVAR